jgi:hypothetical protein
LIDNGNADSTAVKFQSKREPDNARSCNTKIHGVHEISLWLFRDGEDI